MFYMIGEMLGNMPAVYLEFIYLNMPLLPAGPNLEN